MMALLGLHDEFPPLQKVGFTKYKIALNQIR